jgi:nitric oxide reductase NorD protein
MEEIVGKAWHKLISRWTYQGFPDEGIYLSEIEGSLAIFFRAMGGDGALRIAEVNAMQHGARQNIMQKIAGSGLKMALAMCDDDTLRLPKYLDAMPSKSLNRSHYFWLAALASIPEKALYSQSANVNTRDINTRLHWAEIARRRTLCVLSRYPGLRHQYQNLVAAHLQQRPSPNTLPSIEADEERQIRQLLTQPEQSIHLPHWHKLESKSIKHKKPVMPVSLWLNPFPPFTKVSDLDSKSGKQNDEFHKDAQVKKSNKRRHQAEQVDMPDESESSLLAIRHETDLFSLSEMLKVKRAPDENEELDNLDDMADDLDYLSIAKDDKTSAKRIQFDLDMGSTHLEHESLTQGIRYPEWHYKKQRLIPDLCRVYPLNTDQNDEQTLPIHLVKTASLLRRQFSSIRSQRHWRRNQEEGDELDLESYINFFGQKDTLGSKSSVNLYQKLMAQNRDLASLVLADLSLSTQAGINDEIQVIDVIKDSLYLFAECLEETHDQFALYGFNSQKRERVDFLKIKAFNEKYSPLIRGNIHQIRPGYYTRMGAAIRHASQILQKQKQQKKVLLLLSDGKPNDLDQYDGRYGLEDTRQAIKEAKQLGLITFCITIDQQAEAYLPYIFGRNGYASIKNIEELPKELPELYAQLTEF